MWLALSLAVLAAAANGGTAAPKNEEKQIGIAVLDLQTSGDVAADLPKALSGLVSARLDKAGVFRIITEDEVKRMVSFDQMKTALSCDDQASCLADVGAALGVPWLFTGTIGRIGSSYTLSFALVEIDKARVDKRTAATFADVDRLLSGLDAEVERAVASLLYREQGSLLVIAAEEGATIAVDGAALGTTPLTEQKVASGPHRITASKDGFIQYAVDVVVRPREQTRIDAVLRPSPEFLTAYRSRAGASRAAAWGTTVAAVALGAAGAGLTVGPNAWIASQDAGPSSTRGAPLSVDATTATTVYALYWSGWGALALGAASAGAATWFWAIGEDPARYDDVAVAP